MSSSPTPGVAPVEMLLDWESPAINDPAMADRKSIDGSLADPGTLASAALWLGDRVALTVLGNSLSDALKVDVTSFLAAWRTRQGHGKLEELKRQVLDEIVKRYPDPQQGERLRQAVEQLFGWAKE